MESCCVKRCFGSVFVCMLQKLISFSIFATLFGDLFLFADWREIKYEEK